MMIGFTLSSYFRSGCGCGCRTGITDDLLEDGAYGVTGIADFGSGLLQMVFAPAGTEVATALKFTIQAAVQRWLGDLIAVQSLEVTSADGALTVAIQYMVRQSAEQRTDTFIYRGGP